MGIQGLLPLLSTLQKRIHISELKGQSVAVDAYVWLHRGVFSCAMDLALGLPTKRHIQYCLNRAKQLKQFGIWPILVFDGAPLPMKSMTESDRKRKRMENREKAMAFKESGRLDKAMEYFQMSIDVTPKMAHELIQELKKEGIEFLVAPYEADAQLAYLENQGIVSAIITEDSDLFVFGCRKVIYKLDATGHGVLICRKDFGRIKEFRLWTDTRFRQMCILSGCDYLASPPGIGIKKAQKLLLHKDAYELLRSWTMWGTTVKAPKLPSNYEMDFKRAEWTFLHQRVFDSQTGRLVPLTPFTKDLKPLEMDFIGPDLDPNIAKGIAYGEIDPISKMPFNASPMDKPRMNFVNASVQGPSCTFTRMDENPMAKDNSRTCNTKHQTLHKFIKNAHATTTQKVFKKTSKKSHYFQANDSNDQQENLETSRTTPSSFIGNATDFLDKVLAVKRKRQGP